MPKSKHRKHGGKAVENPGRAWAAIRPTPKPDFLKAWLRFTAFYVDPFRASHGDLDAAIYLLDLVAAAVFDPFEETVRPASKAALFAEFTKPLEAEDGSVSAYSLDMADAELAYLVHQDMVVAIGDVVQIHPRFPEAMAREA